jgi:hypothetical protein
MKIDGLTIETWFERLNPSAALMIEGEGNEDNGGGGDGGGGEGDGDGDGDGGEGGDGDGDGDGNGDGEEGDGEYQDDPALTAKENQKAREAFEKEKSEGGGKPKDDGKDKKPGDKDEKSELIGAPEGDYEDFDIPEGFTLNEAVKTEFDEVSRELNLSDAGRKRLVELQAKLYNDRAEAHATEVAEWGENIAKDKVLGGRDVEKKKGIARQAVAEFGDQELKELLENTGYGNHPSIVRFAYRAGLALGEGTVEPGKDSSGEEDAATILYGGS